MPTIRSTGLLGVCLTIAFVFCADVWAGEAWHIAERAAFYSATVIAAARRSNSWRHLPS